MLVMRRVAVYSSSIMTKLSLTADDHGGIPPPRFLTVEPKTKPRKKAGRAEEGPTRLADVFKGQRKWNVPLAMIFLGLLNLWYVRHFAPSALGVALTNAVWLLPWGVLSALGGSILEDLGKWWNTFIEDRNKRITRFLAAGCVLAAILNAITSSITLRASTGGLHAVIELADRDGSGEIAVELPETHHAELFFFRTKQQSATIRLVEPRGFAPLQKEFGRWDALDLTIPDSFSEKRLHLVELLGWPGLISLLPEDSDEASTPPYELWVQPTESGADAVRLSGDLRRGLFVLGAAKADLAKVAAAETGAAREDSLRRLARKLGETSAEEEAVRNGWATQPRHLIATDEYAPGTKLEFTVRRGGRPVATCTVTISDNDASDITHFLLQKP